MTVPFELHVYHHDEWQWAYDVDVKLIDGSLLNLDADAGFKSQIEAEAAGRRFIAHHSAKRRSPRQRVDVADLVPLLVAGQ